MQAAAAEALAAAAAADGRPPGKSLTGGDKLFYDPASINLCFLLFGVKIFTVEVLCNRDACRHIVSIL